MIVTLGRAREITIRTRCHPARAVVIWAVAVGDDLFARSYRGARGEWYRDLLSGGRAVLELDGRQWPVQGQRVTDPETIAAVTAAYRSKYADSPYLAPMVAADVLHTTLQLVPVA